MLNAVKLYQMLMGSSILLSAGTLSLILSSTSSHWRQTGNATIVGYAYALPPSLALVHHIISSLCSQPDLPSPQTRLSAALSVGATRKHISSTTNLLCLALLAIFVLSSGFAVLVQSVVEFAALDHVARSAATIAEGSGSVAAATGLKDSLAGSTLVLQALLQITQGIVLGWIFGVAAQEARVVTAIERGLHPIGIMVQVDVEHGDSQPTLSYDEADEDEDK